MMHQPDPIQSSALSAEQTPEPTQRQSSWSKVLFLSILGIVSAILIMLMLSCPILFLLRWGQPGGSQTDLTQNGTPQAGDSSQSVGSTTPTSSSGTPQGGDSAQPAGSITPVSGTPSGGDSA